jgi:hypothetical protein
MTLQNLHQALGCCQIPRVDFSVLVLSIAEVRGIAIHILLVCPLGSLALCP